MKEIFVQIPDDDRAPGSDPAEAIEAGEDKEIFDDRGDFSPEMPPYDGDSAR